MRTSPPIVESEQELLDGLPIPAAKLGRTPGGPIRVERANEQFRRLACHDERLRGPLAADIPLLNRGLIGSGLQAFLESDDAVSQFEAEQGDRYFVVRFSRLSGAERCLLTLLDRTAQLGLERSFRPAPARDRLTGLPSARAFEERVDELTGHPNFKSGSHAVLTVTLAGEAGDELLLAAARRLLSALRAGDLLARTAGPEFRILMRLDRGLSDALELAERLQVTLTAPFRLTDAELLISCTVECAALN